jgi:dTDP-4-dehydrorhamnose 3,5-epimerase
MKITTTPLDGVIVLEPVVYGDERGYFLETWSRQRYIDAGITADFCQDNTSCSGKGILRGLHYQYPDPQGKLVSVASGEVFDVAVDIRLGSPTFGKNFGAILSEQNHKQMYIPPGFAHGFCVLSDAARFAYKCTAYFNARYDRGIAFDDPDIDVAWPVDNPLVSQKDSSSPRLADIPHDNLPKFGEAF